MFDPIAFVAYAFATSITPGPNNLMSLALGSKLGFARASVFNWGVAAGQMVVMGLCTAFCVVLSSWMPQITSVMKPLGTIYLLFLAYKTLTLGRATQGKEVSSVRLFALGFVLQTVNPKMILSVIVAVQIFVLPAFAHDHWAQAACSIFLATVGSGCTFIWSAFGSGLRSLFEKYSLLVNAILCALLIGCAVSI